VWFGLSLNQLIELFLGMRVAKRRYNPTATREDILDAAERLFAAHGFGDVSTRRVAKEAGVSQSQIHYHFGTKRRLCGAVFERGFGEYSAVQSSVLKKADVKGLDRMAESIRACFGFFRDNPPFVKLLGRIQLEGITDSGEPMAAELMQGGSKVIAQAQRAGELRADVEPQFILIGFLSLVAYWFQCRGKYLPESGLPGAPEAYDEKYLDFILKVYLRGIAR